MGNCSRKRREIEVLRRFLCELDDDLPLVLNPAYRHPRLNHMPKDDGVIDEIKSVRIRRTRKIISERTERLVATMAKRGIAGLKVHWGFLLRTKRPAVSRRRERRSMDECPVHRYSFNC